ncbi:hypothetical protein Ciccas_012920, partial [Cichlidogyrus casuarinus]
MQMESPQKSRVSLSRPQMNTTLDTQNEMLVQSLAELQEEYRKYREDKSASDKLYTDTIESLRGELTDHRIRLSRANSQLEFTNEKLKAVETNVASYKQEISILNEMNARYSASAAATDAEMLRLREDLFRATEKQSKLEIDARKANQQLDMAKSNEDRWRREVEQIHQQSYSHQQILNQMRSIEAAMQHHESLERRKLEGHSKEYEKLLLETKEAREMDRLDRERQCAVLEENNCLLFNQVKELEEKLVDAENALAKSKQDAETERDRLLARIASATKPASESGSSVTMAHEDDVILANELLAQSKEKCLQLEQEVDRLKLKLDTSQEMQSQLKSLTENAETRLTELASENEKAMDKMRGEMDALTQKYEATAEQLDSEQQKAEISIKESREDVERSQEEITTLKANLEQQQTQMQELQLRLEAALELEAGAKERIDQNAQLAQEARTKYERVLAMHAEDLDTLSKTRVQLDESRVQMNSLHQQLEAVQCHSELRDQELLQESKRLEVERADFTLKSESLMNENATLRDQILKLSTQLVSLRKLLENRADESPNTSLTINSPSTQSDAVLEDIRTSDELLEIVNHLRHQKSLSEASAEVASKEVYRLLHKTEQLERQVATLVTELEDERSSRETSTLSNQRHEEIMSKVEQLSIMSESNRLLRQERTQLQSSLDQARDQCDKLQAELEPLNSSIKMLFSEREAAAADFKSLEEERDRWKARCSYLVETSERMDPEQYRIACKERDVLQTDLNKLKDELQASQKFSEDKLIELANLAEQKAQCEGTILSLQEEMKRVSENISERDTMLAKIRDLARKYKHDNDQ